jgi:hypothetical protein
MDFYFSGVESKEEIAMLREAGASRLLVDPTQIKRLGDDLDGFRLALDSGAYRLFKMGLPNNVEWYEGWVRDNTGRFEFDFVTSLDDFEDRTQNYRTWWRLRAVLEGVADVLPVWHYDGAAADDWPWYLRDSQEVGVGGLVPHLFTKADHKDRHWCRQLVRRLCEEQSGRLRLFGACDLPLLNSVRGHVLSADSSFWLRGRRRGAGFYVNRQTGKLSEAAPWLMEKLAGDYPEIADLKRMDGRERSVANARALEAYFNGG